MSSLEVKHKSEFLFSEITNLIEESRKAVAVTVNATLTMLYWNIGKKINEEVLNNQRADYGDQIIINLSKDLSATYGNGWGVKQLRHCLRTAETFPDKQIVYALSRQLTWTHDSEKVA
jgi:hypothetical protein